MHVSFAPARAIEVRGEIAECSRRAEASRANVSRREGAQGTIATAEA